VARTATACDAECTCTYTVTDDTEGKDARCYSNIMQMQTAAGDRGETYYVPRSSSQKITPKTLAFFEGCCVEWTFSDFFVGLNGVKQGVVASPMLYVVMSIYRQSSGKALK